MAPQHDEILRATADGFTVAWDSTRADKERIKAVGKVVKAQADELGVLFGGEIPLSRRRQPAGHGAAAPRSKVTATGS